MQPTGIDILGMPKDTPDVANVGEPLLQSALAAMASNASQRTPFSPTTAVTNVKTAVRSTLRAGLTTEPATRSLAAVEEEGEEEFPADKNGTTLKAIPELFPLKVT